MARADNQMMSCRDAIQDRDGCQTRRYSKAAGAISRFGYRPIKYTDGSALIAIQNSRRKSRLEMETCRSRENHVY